MARVVTGPDGRRWRIRRRWLPWKPRKKGPWLDVDPLWFELGDLDFVSGPFAFFVALLIAIGVGLFLAWVIPFIITIVELVVVFVLLPLFVIARLAFRTPWIVVADTRGPPVEQRALAVAGWRKSDDAIEELAREISLGAAPSPQRQQT